MTLQEQYNLISEGKGNKVAFLKEVKRNHSNVVSNLNTFDQAVSILKGKGVINENTYYADLQPITQLHAPNKQGFEKKFDEFLREAAKTGKSANEVAEIASHNFDYEDQKNLDNQVGQEVLNGVYLEIQKNPKITQEAALKTVSKNLAKDRLYYVKDGQFGVDGLGYEEPVQEEVTGDHAASGYSAKLKKMVKESLTENIGGVATTGHKDSIASVSGDLIKQMMAETEAKINEMGMDLGDYAAGVEPEVCEVCGMEACGCDHGQGDDKLDMAVNLVPLGEEEDLEEEAIVADEEPAIKIPKKNKKMTLQKRMSEIEKLGTALALEAKMEALDEEITLREDQMSMLDENESMAALMDPKKLKEIKNEIKLLERKKGQYKKMHEKASKAAKKNDE